MILRNNYFGSFTHFSTLYEYLEKRKQGQPLGDPVDLQYREGSVGTKRYSLGIIIHAVRTQSNVLQIQLETSVERGLVIMPAGLRGYETDQSDNTEGDIGTCVMLALPELQIHLRSHEYYMGTWLLYISTLRGTFLFILTIELALNNDMIAGSVHTRCPEDLDHAQKLQRAAKEIIIIDGKILW